MQQPEANRINIAENDDLVIARARVRDAAIEMGFSHIDQVRLVTAVSELARNIVRYAEAGFMEIRKIANSGRRGLQVRFEDRGRGIEDIELAMTDGYTSGRGLGKGLPGSRRLVDDFEIQSEVGRGTIVVITKWL
ncbi:MAG TPA: anti-sigma regulatory factor [Blastocatellia bacterium]|jgi:serine/threonine-protein kinase RsbT|nr:anti-sigma regulatory factor [Blastocatellia bacterium]